MLIYKENLTKSYNFCEIFFSIFYICFIFPISAFCLFSTGLFLFYCTSALFIDSILLATPVKLVWQDWTPSGSGIKPPSPLKLSVWQQENSTILIIFAQLVRFLFIASLEIYIQVIVYWDLFQCIQETFKNIHHFSRRELSSSLGGLSWFYCRYNRQSRWLCSYFSYKVRQ